MTMRKNIDLMKNSLLVLSLFAMALFFGCKKEEPCKTVIQGDFELVE